MANIPLTAASTRRKRAPKNTRGRRNGWSAKWSDELKLKEGDTAWIILTPGDYPAEEGDRTQYLGIPMYKVQYTNKWGDQSWEYFRGNGHICTLKDRADCGDSRVTAPRYGEANRFYMNVIHLDLFRREEVKDKTTGNPLRYKHGKLKGEIVHRWSPVTSIRERKDMVRDQDFENCCFFRKKFLQLPTTHFEGVKGIGRQAQTMCRCGGSLFPSVFTCGECEEILLDVNETELSESEVKRYGDGTVRCHTCGHTDYPAAHSLCDTCDDPQSFRFWEVAAQITKVRDGQWPTIRVLKVVPLSEYQLPDGSCPIVIDEDGHPELDEDGNRIFPEDIGKLVKSQFDFEGYTEPKDNSHYSELLELSENDVGFVSASKNYGSFR